MTRRNPRGGIYYRMARFEQFSLLQTQKSSTLQETTQNFRSNTIKGETS